MTVLRTLTLVPWGSASEFLSHRWAECGLLRVLMARPTCAQPRAAHHSSSSCQGAVQGLPRSALELPRPPASARPRRRRWSRLSRARACPAAYRWDDPRCTPPLPGEALGLWPVPAIPPRPASRKAPRHACPRTPQRGGRQWLSRHRRRGGFPGKSVSLQIPAWA